MIERFASWSRGCLTMQGYDSLSDGERRSLWLGLRFSPMLCLAGIAYVYDAVLRPLLGGPHVPPSPAPRRFACQLATPWIAAIAVAFWVGVPTVAWVLAVPLLMVAMANTITNWCLPSLIYGLLHRGRPGEATS